MGFRELREFGNSGAGKVVPGLTDIAAAGVQGACSGTGDLFLGVVVKEERCRSQAGLFNDQQRKPRRYSIAPVNYTPYIP